MADKLETRGLRVQVKLGADARAILEGSGYELQVSLLIHRRDGDEKASCTFNAGSNVEVAQSLIDRLRRDRAVELVLDEKSTVKYITVDRIDYHVLHFK